MSTAAKRWVLGIGALVMVAIVGMSVVFLLPGDDPVAESAPPAKAEAASPAAAAQQYLSALNRGDRPAAAGYTDAPTPAAAKLAGTWSSLSATRVQAELAGPAPAAAEGPVSVGLKFSWTLKGKLTWAYDSTLELAPVPGGWRVRWNPAQLHPKLTAETRLVFRGGGDHPVVVDRDGKPLFVRHGDGVAPVAGFDASVLTGPLTRAAEQSISEEWAVELRDASDGVLEKLGGAGHEIAPLTAGISSGIQAAARAAVGTVTFPAMLVAIHPGSGDLLAVAQNDAVGIEPKALNGLYPPGSTFKIATASAAMQAGTGAGTLLECPGEARIGQRTIPNDGGFALPPSPLHTAFARSCNTTFGRLAEALPADGLAAAAGQLGLNADFDIPDLTTEAGKVGTFDEPTRRIEAGIGQGEVLASPFGVALMSATVASGKAVTPRLLRGDGHDTTVLSGYQAPPAPVVGALRSMMREVVTGGTAQALARYGDLRGKTGTAQFGNGDVAHGWFTGYRGEVAFAVLVESAGTSADALKVSAKFLDEI